MTNKIDWKSEEIISQLRELAENTLSSKDIAAILSDRLSVKVNDRSVRRVANENDIELKMSKNNGYNEKNHIEVERHADGSIEKVKSIEMTEEQSKDDGFLLKAHGFDPEKWEIINAKTGFWEQNSNNSGKTKLYSSRITVKPIKNAITPEMVARKLNGKISPITIKNEQIGRDNLVIPLFDMHFGIETFESLQDKLEQVVYRIHNGYENITIIVGGDYLHSNEMDKTVTVKGTILDDVDNEKALDDATRFMSILIEESIKNSKNVNVYAIGGNHDFSKQYMFIWGLKMKYPQVDIDLTMETRTAFNIGHVGIMVAHGDVAVKRLPMLFATEYTDVWANSTYRAVFTGHIHTEKKEDIDGVMLWRFGTPKKSDPYEKKNGFTMARKHLQLLEFNDNRLLSTYEVE